PIELPGEVEVVEEVSGDPLSVRTGRWVPLVEHLDDVRREVAGVLEEVGHLPGLTAAHRDAATLAGMYHDIGKAHPVFAASLSRAGGGAPPPDGTGPWAKSPSRAPLRHAVPYFRHELVSALMLLDSSCRLLDGVGEPDLVTYLVGAHHGKARL